MENVVFRITDDLRANAEERARETNRTLSNYLRNLITQDLKNDLPKK